MIIWAAKRASSHISSVTSPSPPNSATFAASMSGADFGDGGGEGGDGAEVSSFALRKLEDTVSFESFRGGREIDELFYVCYYPSGRCEGYTVTLADGEGRRRSVTVDPITGKAKVQDG